MTRIILALHCAVATACAFSQPFSEQAAKWFDEIRSATSAHDDLWGRDIYAHILLVDPNSRQLFANRQDQGGILRAQGRIFTGTLPSEVNIANTSMAWSGTRWAMVRLPLPADAKDRISLLAHELFHASQPALGFKQYNPANDHLDEKEGRIYLRLELEALQKALQSTGSTRKEHLTNALTFRAYRRSLYPGADSTENLLELNEGLAEFTGLVVSGRGEKDAISSLVKNINTFIKNPTYVRSFAYQTVPAYGHIVGTTRPGWALHLTATTDLTALFIDAFGLHINPNPDVIQAAMKQYDGARIVAEENARQKEKDERVAECFRKFVTEPHLDIGFENMNISFDPGNIMPLGTPGTVYPNLRVTDNWGILTADEGALISSGWDRVTVTAPTINDREKVGGEGWVLELKDGYTVVRESSGNYVLKKD